MMSKSQDHMHVSTDGATSTTTPTVTVIGAGLAGCEAAWQLAQGGIRVRLIEMKPAKKTPAQNGDYLAELVCSNSLRSMQITNAVGLLKEEMRRLGSLIIQHAHTARVPAGDALAVDREIFGRGITEAISTHPNIERISDEVTALPPASHGPVIVATGPLTADALAQDIAAATSRDRLYFYDAIAPILSGDSIDRSIVFAASRYGKGDGDDYLNCPMTQPEYDAFIDAILQGECMPLHAFEEPRYFQGCLPIEVLAHSGRETLRFGTMKPVGLRDPRTGQRPHAVVQLRKEDQHGQAYNIVGFQTKLKYPEQQRIFRMIPGLAQAEFLRLGAIHRNTYLDSPAVLDHRMALRTQPHIHFAGQITGVEGYVESAAHGLMTALLLRAELQGRPLSAPPSTCAIGALWHHVTGDHRMPGRPHEPQNVNWSMFPPQDDNMGKKNKVEAKNKRVVRAVKALEAWATDANMHLLPPIEHTVLHAATTESYA